MSIAEVLGASWQSLGATVIATIAIYATVILATRAWGLRSFAKMSSFDFAATVATGSILATTALTSAPLVLGVVAVAVLYACQAGVAALRRSGVRDFTDNAPMLLMDGQRVLEHNMAAAQITKGDLIAKLREANVTRMKQIRYVVLETTGDVSVLHAEPDAPPVEEELLFGVRR